MADDVNFNSAIEKVLKHEGGFVNTRYDKGGATNYGISLNFLKSLGKLGDLNDDGRIDENDIKIIDKEEAIKIYKKEIWDKEGYGRINNEIVAEAIFDFAVNLGPVKAHKLIQKAINLHNTESILKEDGLLGNDTICAINISNPLKFMLFFRSVVIWHYIQITEKDASQKKFINGWLKRVWGGV